MIPGAHIPGFPRGEICKGPDKEITQFRVFDDVACETTRGGIVGANRELVIQKEIATHQFCLGFRDEEPVFVLEKDVACDRTLKAKVQGNTCPSRNRLSSSPGKVEFLREVVVLDGDAGRAHHGKGVALVVKEHGSGNSARMGIVDDDAFRREIGISMGVGCEVNVQELSCGVLDVIPHPASILG